MPAAFTDTAPNIQSCIRFTRGTPVRLAHLSLLQIDVSETQVDGVHVRGVCHKVQGPLVARLRFAEAPRQVVQVTGQSPDVRVLHQTQANKEQLLDQQNCQNITDSLTGFENNVKNSDKTLQ